MITSKKFINKAIILLFLCIIKTIYVLIIITNKNKNNFFFGILTNLVLYIKKLIKKYKDLKLKNIIIF